MLASDIPETPKPIQAIDIVLGCPSELCGKTAAADGAYFFTGHGDCGWH